MRFFRSVDHAGTSLPYWVPARAVTRLAVNQYGGDWHVQVGVAGLQPGTLEWVTVLVTRDHAEAVRFAEECVDELAAWGSCP